MAELQTNESSAKPFFDWAPPKTNETTTTSSKVEEEDDPESESPAIEFKPVVSLSLVEVKTMEEEELELVKVRAKLYRFETNETPAEWKERGVGDVKLLKNPKTNSIRVLMRRDKTLKICANHSITPLMELKPHSGNSDKAFVWSTLGDFSDGEPRPETLCIRFGSVENATKFKDAFYRAKTEVLDLEDKRQSVGDVKQDCSVEGEEADDEDEEDSKDENGNATQDSIEEGLNKLNLDSNEKTEPTASHDGQDRSNLDMTTSSTDNNETKPCDEEPIPSHIEVEVKIENRDQNSSD